MTESTSSANTAPQPGSVLRSTLFMLGMVPTTVLFAVLGIFTLPFSFRVRYGFMTQWSTFNLWWLKVTCNLRFEVEGREHIPDVPSVILCKHQSAFETMALQRVFPPHVWLLKRELLWLPFFGWGLAMLEPVAIDRKAGRKALAQLLETGAKRLADGRWVVIFPEGTRVAPGQKGRYAPGGAMLAVRSGCPVVPVAHNAGEFWPRHGFIKRPGVIRIVIGPVIDTKALSAQEVNTQSEAWIEGVMARISNPYFLAAATSADKSAE